MTNKEIKNRIMHIIENGYAETSVGYHPEYRWVHGNWRRGAFARIAGRYGATVTLYANSYRELLDTVREYMEWFNEFV